MRSEARVVHEQLRLDLLRRELRLERGRRSARSEVERDDLDAHAALGANRLRQLLHPLAPPRDEHEIMAARRELPSELDTEAGGRAGDDGPAFLGHQRRLPCRPNSTGYVTTTLSSPPGAGNVHVRT